jgi:hypothetical protein
MSMIDRLAKPFARRAMTPALLELDRRLELLASRLESHTVNLAEYQAQLRDETMRQIINEIRSNSAFLAHSVVALERVEARRRDLVHAAVRPFVHESRRELEAGSNFIVVDHIDTVLVDELVTDGHRITVVNPAIDSALPSEVVINTSSIVKFRGPTTRVAMVVWVMRSMPSAEEMGAVRGWLTPGARCIVAAPTSIGGAEGFTVEESRTYRRSGTTGFRRVRTTGQGEPGAAEVELVVELWRAA